MKGGAGAEARRPPWPIRFQERQSFTITWRATV